MNIMKEFNKFMKQRLEEDSRRKPIKTLKMPAPVLEAYKDYYADSAEARDIMDQLQILIKRMDKEWPSFRKAQKLFWASVEKFMGYGDDWHMQIDVERKEIKIMAKLDDDGDEIDAGDEEELVTSEKVVAPEAGAKQDKVLTALLAIKKALKDIE